MTLAEIRRLFIASGFQFKFEPSGNDIFKFTIFRSTDDIPVTGAITPQQFHPSGLIIKEQGKNFVKEMISIYK